MTTPLAAPDALRAWGWNEWVAEAVAATDVPSEDGVAAHVGRVGRVDNTHALVHFGDRTSHVPLAQFPGEDEETPATPTTGDWTVVAIEDEPVGTDVEDREGAEIEPRFVALLPRWSALTRVDAMGRRAQVLAANVDDVLIVHGLDRPMKAGRIERTMALVWDGGAQPVVVLTKADLCDEHTIGETMDALANIAAGVDIFVTASRTGAGIDELRAALPIGNTAALLGESGGGKSTLANALVGEEVAATAAVRAGDAKGRHTTVTRDLVPIPGAGVLVDTPGLRAVGLYDASDGIAQVFNDIEELAAQCRFADCAHRVEPKCAVRRAVADGSLDPERVERYLALLAEMAAQDVSREDARRARSRTGRNPGKPPSVHDKRPR